MGSTYDVRTTGYQFASALKSAYEEANTNFTIANAFNTNIPLSDLPNISTNQALLDWGDGYASNGVNHDPNTVVLFAVRDHSDPAITSLVFGVTGRSPVSPKKCYAFIFGKRIDDNLTGQNRQVTKTRVAIHELGHARGKDVNPDPFSHDTPRNEGRNKGTCVMLSLEYDPQKAFHFCERHKQVLLNISW